MPEAELAEREVEALNADTLVINRNRRGTQIWGIVPAADTDYTVHVGVQAPSRIPAPGSRASTQLFLSKIDVSCRAGGGSDGFGQSHFESIAAYDGDTEIATFATPGWRGGQRTLVLETIKPFEVGLDIVYRLGTPLGFASSFEIRSTTVTLARPRAVPSPGDTLGRVRRAIGLGR